MCIRIRHPYHGAVAHVEIKRHQLRLRRVGCPCQEEQDTPRVLDLNMAPLKDTPICLHGPTAPSR